MAIITAVIFLVLPLGNFGTVYNIVRFVGSLAYVLMFAVLIYFIGSSGFTSKLTYRWF